MGRMYENADDYPFQDGDGLSRRGCVRSREDRDKLVVDNLRLVYCAYDRVSRCYGVKNLCRDDAIQAGMLRMIRAAELWDENFGVKFSTYAVRSVLNAILCEAMRAPTIPVKPSKSGRHPKQRYRVACVPCMRLDFLRGNGSGDDDSFAPAIHDPDVGQRLDEEEILKRVFKYLTEEDKQLVQDIYYQEKTYQQCATPRGITREAVRQRLIVLNEKMRKAYRKGVFRCEGC